MRIIFLMDLLWTGWSRIESILQKDRYLAYEASRPVTGAASKGAALFRRKAAEQAKRRIKKVEAGKKFAKKAGKKAAKDTAKTVAKETAK